MKNPQQVLGAVQYMTLVKKKHISPWMGNVIEIH